MHNDIYTPSPHDTPIIFVSFLKRINQKTGLLSQGSITGWKEYADFASFKDDIFALRYPKPQTEKFQCYGWVPTVYLPTDQTFRDRVTGEERVAKNINWRCGRAEASTVSAFVADVDNDSDNLPQQTIDAVTARLEAAGYQYFLYTSFSHRDDHHKFRIVMSLSRPVTRDEMLRIFIALNWTVFGQQGDPSIYDPGDYVYAPPFNTVTRDAMSGVPLDVDALLGEADALKVSQPQAYGCIADREAKKMSVRRKVSPRAAKAHLAKVSRVMADMTVRFGMTIKNPDVFSPTWLPLYASAFVNRSHWESMRSLLGSVWAKSGGDLTYGEMAKLFDEIDATAGNYFDKKYGAGRKRELIEWVMQQVVESHDNHFDDERDKQETHEAVPPHAPGAGFAWNVIDSACGDGKSYTMRDMMVAQRGRWLYVVDKIERIHECIEEFQRHHKKNILWTIHDAHSAKDDDSNVFGQLAGIRNKLDKCPGLPSVTFITHAAASMLPWDDWDDHKLIIDEKLGVWACDKIMLTDTFDVLTRYFVTKETHDDRYLLALTDAGKKAGSQPPKDALVKRFWPLLSMCHRGRHVWVNKEGWDNPRAEELAFWALVTPESFAPFKERWMVGDYLTKSLTYKMWETQYGVTWNVVPFVSQRPPRKRSLAERVTVRYFTDSDGASFTRFKQADGPLQLIASHVAAQHPTQPVLWTTNKKFIRWVGNILVGDYVTPRQTGTDRYKAHTVAVWLAAMQAPQAETDIIKKLTGWIRRDLDIDREFDAMNQFVMRTSARDWDADSDVIWYVMSRMQAEYLHDRYGVPIEKVDGVVKDRVRKSRGKSKTGEAMTSTERSRKHRQAKADATIRPLIQGNDLQSRCMPTDEVKNKNDSVGFPLPNPSPIAPPVPDNYAPSASTPATTFNIVDLPPGVGHKWVNDKVREWRDNRRPQTEAERVAAQRAANWALLTAKRNRWRAIGAIR